MLEYLYLLTLYNPIMRVQLEQERSQRLSQNTYTSQRLMMLTDVYM